MSLGVQRIKTWLGIRWPVSLANTNAERLHTLVGGLLAAPIYTLFAVTNLYAYGAVKMASVTAFAAVVALLALLLLRHCSTSTIPGHCFTLALAIQVFGEMTLNGGLQAPATALSLLIVPAAIFTAGASAIAIWGTITIIAISSIFAMDINGVLPANELPLSAQQFDRMFSLSAGILVTSVLVYLFQRKTNQAISKLSEERANFEYSALHDILTGMPNRRYFYQHVNESLDAARLNSGNLTLFYFDIDRFKQINDTYGHAAGDELLISFAARLANKARGDDLAARLSGDEFALIANSTDSTLDEYIGHLRTMSDLPFTLSGTNLDIGMSFGYASFPADGEDLDTLLQVADKRMYIDKSTRRTAGMENAPNIIQLPKGAEPIQLSQSPSLPQRRCG